MFNNNINIQNNINNESIVEEFSIFNTRNVFPVLDFNLANKNSSDSLFNCSMYLNWMQIGINLIPQFRYNIMNFSKFISFFAFPRILNDSGLFNLII
jgi:hypothetical protein